MVNSSSDLFAALGVYPTLASIADSNAAGGYLRGYSADLHEHDKRTLAESKAGDRFVWALRDHGTELFAIAAGRDAVWLTYWLDGGGCSAALPALCFLVEVLADGGASGKVSPISHDKARKLAAIPHPQGFVQRWKGLS
jgi:hypothetical protein